MARARWTPWQHQGATFALEELRRLHDARIDYMQIVLGIGEVCAAHGIPFPGSLTADGADSISRLHEVINALAGEIEGAEITPADAATCEGEPRGAATSCAPGVAAAAA